MGIGNDGKSSQPSFSAPVEPMEMDLEERMDALYGAVSRTVAGVESANHCLNRLEALVVQMCRDIRVMKQTIETIEERTAQIPAIKELLVEALTVSRSH